MDLESGENIRNNLTSINMYFIIVQEKGIK